MKILAIGGGSMGRRRLRDLTHLNRGEVILFEPNRERCEQVAAGFGVRGLHDFESAWAQKPDVLTISSPPTQHEPYVRRAIAHKLHVFAEVPFVMDEALLSEVAGSAKTYPGVIGVSAAPRYYPPFRLIHDLLQQGRIGRPLYFELSLGNYLPDWHPYEDYRNFYGGDQTQGGAGMDMLLHDMNPIEWWMGKVQSVFARLTKLSSLDIKGPDNHDILLTFASGCRGYFHNDVIEQGTNGRHVRIAGEEGTIEWHQNQPWVRCFDGREKRAQELPFDQAADWDQALAASRQAAELLARQKVRSGSIPTEGTAAQFTYDSCYLREMQHFLEAVEGQHAYTASSPADELHGLQVFNAILRSDKLSREVTVEAGG
jgi:predicted dehydrogenase